MCTTILGRLKMTDFDPRDLTPKGTMNDPRDLAPKGRRSSPDRRQGPRREEERVLHYAEQALVAAVIAWRDARRNMADGRTVSTSYRLEEALDAWERAIYKSRSDG